MHLARGKGRGLQNGFPGGERKAAVLSLGQKENWRGKGTGLISAARPESEASIRWALGQGPSQLPEDLPNCADLVPVQATPAQEGALAVGGVAL